MSKLTIGNLDHSKELSPSEMAGVVGGLTKDQAGLVFTVLVTLGDISAAGGLNGNANANYHAARGVALGAS